MAETRPVRYPPGYPLQIVPHHVPMDAEDWRLYDEEAADYDEGADDGL